MITLREYYRRNIKTCGMSLSIVIDASTSQVLEPIERRRSRTGAHGEDIYYITSDVYVLRYEKSNSGKVMWNVYKIYPDSGNEERVAFKDLPESLKNTIMRVAEEEALELYPHCEFFSQYQ